MTRACVGALAVDPRAAGEADRQDPVAHLRPALHPVVGEGGHHPRHGHDREAGRHATCAPTAPSPHTPAGEAPYPITGHKWFLSAPMCDAFLVLAQAPGGLTVLLGAALPARRHGERAATSSASRTSSATAPTRRRRSSSTRRLRASLVGEEGRGVPTIIEMVQLTRGSTASVGVRRPDARRRWRRRSITRATARRSASRLADQPLMRNAAGRHGAGGPRRDRADDAGSCPLPSSMPATDPARGGAAAA